MFHKLPGQPAIGLALFLTLFACQALAGGIVGTVTEAGTDLTLPEVSIAMEGAGLSRDVLSDIDGKFQIMDLPAGRYQLEFVAFGYLTLTQEVDLLRDETKVFDVTMEIDAVEIERFSPLKDQINPPFSLKSPLLVASKQSRCPTPSPCSGS